jgi:thiamine transporter
MSMQEKEPKPSDPRIDEQKPTPEPASAPPGSRRLALRETILATAGGGMAIAMSTILSLFTLFKMPQGGSLTPASMLPVIFFALAFGPAWGLGACAVYGILQFVIEPYMVNWVSLVLDYPLAFGMLGLAGFFAAKRGTRLAEKNILRRVALVPLPRIILAVVVGMLGRTACHLVSGVVFYAEYAGDQNPWIYSLIYNGSYMLPEAILTTLILLSMAVILRGSARNRR